MLSPFAGVLERGRRVLPAVLAVVGAAAIPPPTAMAGDCGAGGARALSCRPLAERTEWRRSVLDPAGPLIYPKRVTVVGDRAAVSDPGGLQAQGGGATTIRSSAAGAPRLVLDLGADVGGRVEVGVTGASGAAVRLSYSELRSQLTPGGDFNGASLGPDDAPDGRYDVIGGGGARAFASPGIRGGERWIGLQLDGPGTASIDYVRVRYDGYRPSARDYVGRFLSSDPLVNRTWYASVYTTSLDAIRRAPGRRVFVDGAKRDRLVWIGDLAIEGLTAYYSTPAATRILRDSLAVYACQQFTADPFAGFLPEASPIEITCPSHAPTDPANHIPGNPLTQVIPIGSYTAWWVVALGDYYRYSGDGAFVREELPAVRRALAWIASRAHRGLYVTSLSNELNWHPFDAAEGIDAHTNVVYYRALRAAAALERAVGQNPGAARADDRQATATRRELIRLLWDSRAGAFRNNTADPRVNHTQDANVYAVAAGLLSARQAREALRYVRRRLWTRLGPVNGELRDDDWMGHYISPYISSWELWARFEQHDAVGALGLVRRLYGYMATSDPGTMWEKLTTSGRPAAYVPEPAQRQAPRRVRPRGAGRHVARPRVEYRARLGPARVRARHPPARARLRVLADRPSAGRPALGAGPDRNAARQRRLALGARPARSFVPPHGEGPRRRFRASSRCRCSDAGGRSPRTAGWCGTATAAAAARTPPVPATPSASRPSAAHHTFAWAARVAEPGRGASRSDSGGPSATAKDH